MDAWIDNMIASLPPITDEQRRLAVALLALPRSSTRRSRAA
ncbi:hypothetical protein [Nonomuraea sediminis]|nr:hypothetical protein [Nonomuraea sediminis]